MGLTSPQVALLPILCVFSESYRGAGSRTSLGTPQSWHRPRELRPPCPATGSSLISTQRTWPVSCPGCLVPFDFHLLTTCSFVSWSPTQGSQLFCKVISFITVRINGSSLKRLIGFLFNHPFINVISNDWVIVLCPEAQKEKTFAKWPLV